MRAEEEAEEARRREVEARLKAEAEAEEARLKAEEARRTLEHHSASRVQSVARGCSARVAVVRIRSERRVQRAASAICAVARGRSCRARFLRLRQVAVTIQRPVRRLLARLGATELQQARDKFHRRCDAHRKRLGALEARLRQRHHTEAQASGMRRLISVQRYELRVLQVAMLQSLRQQPHAAPAVAAASTRLKPIPASASVPAAMSLSRSPAAFSASASDTSSPLHPPSGGSLTSLGGMSFASSFGSSSTFGGAAIAMSPRKGAALQAASDAARRAMSFASPTSMIRALPTGPGTGLPTGLGTAGDGRAHEGSGESAPSVLINLSDAMSGAAVAEDGAAAGESEREQAALEALAEAEEEALALELAEAEVAREAEESRRQAVAESLSAMQEALSGGTSERFEALPMGTIRLAVEQLASEVADPLVSEAKRYATKRQLQALQAAQKRRTKEEEEVEEVKRAIAARKAANRKQAQQRKAHAVVSHWGNAVAARGPTAPSVGVDLSMEASNSSATENVHLAAGVTRKRATSSFGSQSTLHFLRTGRWLPPPAAVPSFSSAVARPPAQPSAQPSAPTPGRQRTSAAPPEPSARAPPCVTAAPPCVSGSTTATAATTACNAAAPAHSTPRSPVRSPLATLDDDASPQRRLLAPAHVMVEVAQLESFDEEDLNGPMGSWLQPALPVVEEENESNCRDATHCTSSRASGTADCVFAAAPKGSSRIPLLARNARRA